MTDQPRTLYDIVREGRRAKNLTQAQLARRVDCKQPAISMFEKGRRDALAAETIERIARELDIDLASLPAEIREPVGRRGRAVVWKYCPLDDCPASIPYLVHGVIRLHPVAVKAARDEATHCRYCGEVLQSRCPNETCNAPFAGGACCSRCGAPFVVFAEDEPPRPEEWVRARQGEIAALRTLLERSAEPA